MSRGVNCRSGDHPIQPTIRHLPPERLRGLAIPCRLLGQPGGEVFVAVGVATVDRPLYHVAAVGLEVALEAPDDLGDAEGLVAAGGAGEERDGTLGQVEGVLVPLHRRNLGGGTGEERVGGGFGRGDERDDAEFRGGAEMDFGPPGPGQELAAEADAEDGLAGGGVGTGEVEQGGEVAAAIVVVGVHRPAQDQEAVMVGGVVGEVDADLRVQRGDPGRARRHALADQAGGRGRVVLEDQDTWPHRSPAALVEPCRRVTHITAMADHPTVADAARALEEEFALLEDWRDKVEYIIELGKDLPPLPDALKTEGNKVRGCQSQVWLVAEPQPGGRIHLRADSDAVLVKGLISLLVSLYDRRTPREILDNPPDVLERVGLAKLLTPGRSNGLYAMVARIRAVAEAFATAGTA